MNVFLFRLSQEGRCSGTEPGRLCRHAPLRRNVTRFKKKRTAPPLSFCRSSVNNFCHLTPHSAFVFAFVQPSVVSSLTSLFPTFFDCYIISKGFYQAFGLSPRYLHSKERSGCAIYLPSINRQDSAAYWLPNNFERTVTIELALALDPSRFSQCPKNAFQEKGFSRSPITALLPWPIHETPPLTYP